VWGTKRDITTYFSNSPPSHPSSQMPKKAARKATQLPPKTQPHTRFNAKRITPLVSASDQAQTLIDNSVAKSTLSTYKSAQRTILKFLAATRNLPLEDLDLISITPDEFMHFLASLKDQGISSTHTYRAALAHSQKSAQIPTWAKDQQTVALATGARGHHTAADKGVLTPDQVCELLHLVLNSPHPFTAPCKNCWPALHQNPALFNVVLADAIKLQWLARLRPGSSVFSGGQISLLLSKLSMPAQHLNHRSPLWLISSTLQLVGKTESADTSSQTTPLFNSASSHFISRSKNSSCLGALQRILAKLSALRPNNSNGTQISSGLLTVSATRSSPRSKTISRKLSISGSPASRQVYSVAPIFIHSTKNPVPPKL